MNKATGSQEKLTYQFYIALLDIEPVIWRRFQVPHDITFEKLHEVIQVVMGWENYHLYEFKYGPTRVGIPDGYAQTEDEVIDMARVRKLSQMKFSRDDLLTYTYDFGDNWVHLLRLEGIFRTNDEQPVFSCTAGARACPPEDVGGQYGYQHFLQAMADPKHESHEQMLDWHGKLFEAERFDREQVNQALHGFEKLEA